MANFLQQQLFGGGNAGQLPYDQGLQQAAPMPMQKGGDFLRDLIAGGLIAYGNDGNISPYLAMQDRRKSRQEKMAEQQAEQARINQTVEYFKQKDPEIARALEVGAIDGRAAMSMWQEKQKGPAKPTPYTDIARAKADLDAGYITPEIYQQMIAQSGQQEEDVYGQRAQAAAQFGLDPNSPAYQAYVLTGKMPREDQAPLTATDKKAIIEADDMVASNEAAVSALGQAQQYSPNANSGMLAGTRAWLGNKLPDLLVPDWISSPESSLATSNLDNVVMGQALSSMKAIFGGNPTEGEREILLKLQASSSMSKPERAALLERAKKMAQTRLEFNRQRASGLRGGDYYQPGGATPTQGGAVAGPVDPLGIR